MSQYYAENAVNKEKFHFYTAEVGMAESGDGVYLKRNFSFIIVYRHTQGSQFMRFLLYYMRSFAFLSNTKGLLQNDLLNQVGGNPCVLRRGYRHSIGLTA